MILDKETYGNIKHKTFTIGGSGSKTLSPTAVDYGLISTLSGVAGLTQDRVLSLTNMQGALSPAACVSFGMWDSHLFIAATQTCTWNDTMTINMLYLDA